MVPQYYWITFFLIWPGKGFIYYRQFPYQTKQPSIHFSKLSLMDTNSTTPPINSHKFFASLVQSTHSLQYFLEFCSIHSHNKQGDTFNQWHNYVTFWLEVEHHRQLVGEDQSSLERQGIKIYKEFLTNNLNLSLQSKIPQLERLHLISKCTTPSKITLDTFTIAQAHIQQYIIRHIVPSFLTSKQYNEMKKGTSKTTHEGHQSHLLQVLSDKNAYPYLEAYVANYVPESLATMKMWNTIRLKVEPSVETALEFLKRKPEKTTVSMTHAAARSATLAVARLGKTVREEYLLSNRKKSFKKPVSYRTYLFLLGWEVEDELNDFE